MLYLGVVIGSVSLVLFIIVIWAHIKNKIDEQDDSSSAQHINQTNLGLDITSQDLVDANSDNSQQIISLYLFPEKQEYFDGGELYQILLSLDFKFGEINVFHKYALDFDNKQTISFSLTTGSGIGTFDINSIKQEHFKELSLLMKLTKHKIDLKNFKDMYGMGLLLAKQLNGRLCDKNRRLITENHFMEYWKKINQYVYEE